MAEVLRYICPFCGTEVRVGKPCPLCQKADEKKPKRAKRSWEQDESSDGLDLPSDDFDYDEFIAREFSSSPHRQAGLSWYWWALALGLLLAMILSLIWIG